MCLESTHPRADMDWRVRVGTAHAQMLHEFAQLQHVVGILSHVGPQSHPQGAPWAQQLQKTIKISLWANLLSSSCIVVAEGLFQV